jgi:hypothetical protein
MFLHEKLANMVYFPDSAKAVLLACCDPRTLVRLGSIDKSWRQVFKDADIQQKLASKAACGITLYWSWLGNMTESLQAVDQRMYPSSAEGCVLSRFQLMEPPMTSERHDVVVTYFSTGHDIRFLTNFEHIVAVSMYRDVRSRLALQRYEEYSDYDDYANAYELWYDDVGMDLQPPDRMPSYLYMHVRPG